MAFITEIENKAGKFKIGFSIRTIKFEIKPTGNVNLSKVGELFPWHNTYQECLNEASRIESVYLHEELFLRKVIIIRFFSSESETTKKEYGDSERIDEYEGFKLGWYVAEEYQFIKEKRYKLLETNKNNMRQFNNKKVDILGQHFYSREYRLLEYREDLHDFLKSMDIAISEMIYKMVKYFDRDTAKFIANFEKTNFNLKQIGI